MRQRLEEKGAPADRMRVIPNWVDTERSAPQPHDNPWSRAERADGQLRRHALRQHRPRPEPRDARARRRRSSAISTTSASSSSASARAMPTSFGSPSGSDADGCASCPTRAREVLPLSLSAATCTSSGWRRGWPASSSPAGCTGSWPPGRPVVVAADAESETAQVVERVGCGIVIPPSRPELLAEVIRDAHEGRYDLDAMGARGRAVRDGGRGHARRARPLSRAACGRWSS